MIESVLKLRRGDEVRLSTGTARVLFTPDEIHQRIGELGRQVAQDYAGRVPILVAILRGGFIFMCDLARAAGIPQEFDFLSVSRFDPRQRERTAVKVLHDMRSDIRGRDVIVVEGIRTASTRIDYVQTFLKLREPVSLRFAALVRHPDAGDQDVPLEYKGFDVGNEFVVGYGLDHDELYRNLPIIASFEPATKSGDRRRQSRQTSRT